MNVCTRYLKTGQVTDAILSLATVDELRDLHQLVGDDIARIAMQLEKDQEHFLTTGQHHDPDWHRRATYAKKLKGRLHQRIQAALSKRGRVQREERSQTDLGKLLEAMRLVLAPEQRQAVLNMWHRIRAQSPIAASISSLRV